MSDRTYLLFTNTLSLDDRPITTDYALALHQAKNDLRAGHYIHAGSVTIKANAYPDSLPNAQRSLYISEDGGVYCGTPTYVAGLGNIAEIIGAQAFSDVITGAPKGSYNIVLKLNPHCFPNVAPLSTIGRHLEHQSQGWEMPRNLTRESLIRLLIAILEHTGGFDVDVATAERDPDKRPIPLKDAILHSQVIWR